MATEKLNRVYSNNLGTTLTTVYTAPAHASSGTENMSVIISLMVCNTHSAAITADVVLMPGGTSTEINIANNIEIPDKNAVEIIQSRVFLKHDGTDGDVVKVRCDTGSHADVWISTLEGIN